MAFICDSRGIFRLLSRFLGAFLIALVASATASAYTLVMRSHRRIVIPENFIVTRMALTYAVAPGMRVSLQIAAIDVPETEQANNELPGSLLARADSQPGAPS